MNPQPHLTPEELVRASALASSTERSNRSVTFLAMAIIVCIVTGFVTITAARAAADQRRIVLTRVAQQEKMLQLEAQLSILQQNPDDQTGSERYRPETQLRAKLDRISNRLGLQPPATLGNTQDQRLGISSPLVNKVLDVTISNAKAQSALRWLELAQEEIPGLHVMSLEMRPSSAGWTFRIKLGRWETSQ
jgi:hypothetical protein